MQLFPGRLSYGLIFLVGVADLVWVSVSNITVPAHQFLRVSLVIAMMAAVVFFVDRISYSTKRMERLSMTFGYLFQGLIFLQLAWLSLRIFNHVSMSSDFPYVDAMLIDWDEKLGYDWPAYYHFVMTNDTVRTVMAYCYTSLTFVSMIAFLILMLQGNLKRTRFFLETFLATAVVCTVAGLFFPAKAAVATYYGDAFTHANIATLPGVYHILPLERIRSGAPVAFDIYDLPGLVTFPSFHTAAGIILAISFWRTSLFPIILGYTAIMIASTPVFGGHYLVDLIGGVAIAGLVAFGYASAPFYKGLFGRTDTPAEQHVPAPTNLPDSG